MIERKDEWMNLQPIVHRWSSFVKCIAKVSDKNYSSGTFAYH